MVVSHVAECGISVTKNPKPAIQTRVAKPNSTYGKKVKASINGSTSRRE
jgi:hypothetical protein